MNSPLRMIVGRSVAESYLKVNSRSMMVLLSYFQVYKNRRVVVMPQLAKQGPTGGAAKAICVIYGPPKGSLLLPPAAWWFTHTE